MDSTNLIRDLTNDPAAGGQLVHRSKKSRAGIARFAEVFWLALLASAGVGLTVALGTVPTTRNDFFIPGTKINKLQQRIQSVNSCAACHGGYDAQREPLTPWAASMMGQSARDPIFHATLAIANQDAAFAGNLCLRCHTPGGWLAGHAEDPTGANLSEIDYQGVSCNFCHRMVDPQYTAGQSPDADVDILSGIAPAVTTPHSGSFIVDPQDRRRGPFDIGYLNPHPWFQSPYHTMSRMCATCHDVSNPVYARQPNNTYALTAMDAANPSNSKFDQFPVERTFSEWEQSLFAAGPVEMGGRFGINETAVSSCQDCHMPAATGTGAHPELGPIVRTNLPSHFFNGANTWVLKSVRALFDDTTTYLSPESVDASIGRAQQMLRAASDLQLTQVGRFINARVINYSGHKLPTGYAEGRRVWVNVKFFNATNQLIAERGHYNDTTAALTTSDTKVYEAEQGIDAAVAAATGIPVGPGFHFAINNMYYKDNRIPPMGFTNAGFASIQASPVGAVYADGQFWDDTLFEIPAGAVRAEVRTFHQTTTKEYIEFLRDNNTTNSAGQVAYDQWVAQGRSVPTEMDSQTIDIYNCIADVNFDGGVDGSDIEAFFRLWEVSDFGADLNLDGGVDGADIETFFTYWQQGC
jgi:hypothetical protein